MDKTTKRILNSIVKSEEQTVSFYGFDEPFSDIAPSGIIESSVKYLEKRNYITVLYHDDSISKITVSYRAIHPARYIFKQVLSYTINNWIAITALIISVLALLKP